MERLVSEYTNLSSIPSMMDQPSLGTILSYLFVNIEVSFDQDTYKVQRMCTVCAVELKSGSLTAKGKKKHHCKFCFNAVCEGCSNLKIKSQVGEKSNRVCVGCLTSTVKKYFRIVIGPEKEIIAEGKQLEKEISRESEYLALIKDQIARRKLEINEKKKEISEIKNEIKRFSIRNEPLKVKETRNELTKELDMQNTYDWRIKQNQEKLSWLSKSLEERVNAEFELRRQTPKKETGARANANTQFEVLNDQIALLSGLVNIYNRDIQKIRLECMGNGRKSCWIF